jgi:hypothetical protein
MFYTLGLDENPSMPRSIRKAVVPCRGPAMFYTLGLDENPSMPRSIRKAVTPCWGLAALGFV